MGWKPTDRRGWTDGVLSEPWPGFELCFECNGSQLCSEDPHPNCKGWCHICGGAGQWPLDPATPYFAPAAPMINLEYLARQRGSTSSDPPAS